MEIVVATNNRDKMREIREIFKDLNVKVYSLKDLNLTVEVVEDGETFEENAEKKAREVMMLTGKISLADDSGLMVDYLNGLPGVYSARFAGENATYQQNNEKLLKMLEGVPFESRRATFCSVIAMLFPDGFKIITKGEVIGFITLKPKGSNGFGYDPLFYVPEYDKTFAELEPEVKNQISHRAIALKKLKEELKKHFGGNL